MIRIHDPINLLPHLFRLGEPFEQCVNEADVEIWPAGATGEIHNQSDVFTIFVNTEPDIHTAATDYRPDIDKRPNSVFAITATNPHPDFQWPFPTVEFWSNMYLTLKQNETLPALTVQEKPYDACGLFGGWEAGRAKIFEALQNHNLVDRCLINLQPKWNDNLKFTPQELQSHTYYRSPQIPELDDPDFLRLAYVEKGLWTMNTVNNNRFSWVSQKIPYNIYNQVYWNIVTESESHPSYETIFVTEKVSKPLIAGMPFVVHGAVGFLQHLKAHGFKTFDCWIDESYDQEHKTKRVEKLVEAFRSFASQSP